MENLYGTLMELELLSAFANNHGIGITVKDKCSEDGLCEHIGEINVFLTKMKPEYFECVSTEDPTRHYRINYSDIEKVMYSEVLNLSPILLKSYVAMRDMKKIFIRVYEKEGMNFIISGNFDVPAMDKDSIYFTDYNTYYSLHTHSVPNYRILAVVKKSKENSGISKELIDSFDNKV